jgi:NAD(P)-dependent dehydrogenase (short-subunit alcohol dehydrogenase family)
MPQSESLLPVVLVTGGTSGLGFELVKLLAEKGYKVIATGRKFNVADEIKDQVSLSLVDFCDLEQIASAVKAICNKHNIGVVINNAGVFSSPEMILTKDRLEYTFQVNFLSHLLINEIIINKKKAEQELLIVAVTSPVYRTVEADMTLISHETNYKPFKIYSESKLYLTLMCGHLSELYSRTGTKVIGFDPGVFSSGIFRMQGKVLRFLYKIAAPFMRDPANIAESLVDIIENKDIAGGLVYDIKGRTNSIPAQPENVMSGFWMQCYNLIKKYL